MSLRYYLFMCKTRGKYKGPIDREHPLHIYHDGPFAFDLMLPLLILNSTGTHHSAQTIYSPQAQCLQYISVSAISGNQEESGVIVFGLISGSGNNAISPSSQTFLLQQREYFSQWFD